MKKIPLTLIICGLLVTGLIIALPRDKRDIWDDEIERAKRYSKKQEVCTDEYKELVSPDGERSYGARNGCEIAFLEERGWRAPGEERPDKTKVETCLNKDHCGWVSTNCCSENMGANWECLNIEETKIDCPENPVCPAVISPKPEDECSCVEGICQKVGQ